MLGACLAMTLVLGYSMNTPVSWHTQADASGAYASLQSCPIGLGVYAKFQGNEANPSYSGGLQYGFRLNLAEDLDLLITPQVGLGYRNSIHPLNDQRQTTLFNVALGVTLKYKHVGIGVVQDHWSDGSGMHATNCGTDTTTGVVTWTW